MSSLENRLGNYESRIMDIETKLTEKTSEMENIISTVDTRVTELDYLTS